MDQVVSNPNDAEAEILRVFRNYQVRASEMLFFNHGAGKSRPPRFNRALQSLIERGLVVKERHHDAYSLTERGYHVSLSV